MGRLALAGLLLLPVACSLTALGGFSGGGDPSTTPDASSESGSLDGGAVLPDGAPSPEDGGTVLPPSSISFVQTHAQNLGGSGSGNISFKNPVGAKSAIVLAIEHDSTATVTVTDGTVAQYQPVVGPVDDNAGSRSWIFAAVDVPGGDRTLSVTLAGGSGTYLLVYLHEYRGLGAFDVGSSGKGTTKATDGMTTYLTTTTPTALLFSFGFASSRAVVGNGFTKRSDFYDNVTQDRTLTQQGQIAATATMTAGTSWKILAAAFKGN